VELYRILDNCFGEEKRNFLQENWAKLRFHSIYIDRVSRSKERLRIG
jgi:hypothetical protein